MQHVARISYGKDSMAMLHVIADVLGLPLDRIVTADEWATDSMRAEIPEQTAFKERMDGEIFRRWGIRVEHFCATDRNGEKITFAKCAGIDRGVARAYNRRDSDVA